MEMVQWMLDIDKPKPSIPQINSQIPEGMPSKNPSYLVTEVRTRPGVNKVKPEVGFKSSF